MVTKRPKWWAPSIHDEMMYILHLQLYITLTWYFAQIFSKGAKKNYFAYLVNIGHV